MKGGGADSDDSYHCLYNSDLAFRIPTLPLISFSESPSNLQGKSLFLPFIMSELYQKTSRQELMSKCCGWVVRTMSVSLGWHSSHLPSVLPGVYRHEVNVIQFKIWKQDKQPWPFITLVKLSRAILSVWHQDKNLFCNLFYRFSWEIILVW